VSNKPNYAENQLFEAYLVLVVKTNVLLSIKQYKRNKAKHIFTAVFYTMTAS